MRLYLITLVTLFPISELLLLLLKRARSGDYDVQDRRSIRIIWRVIGISVTLAIVANWANLLYYTLHPTLFVVLVSVFMIGGTLLRWTAILTLGRSFTVNVATHKEQRIIDTGVYRWIRHPSYTGSIMQFIALALFFRNGLSTVILLVPITWVFLRRIRQEEEVLLHSFGDVYQNYMKKTKRLIPWVY